MKRSLSSKLVDLSAHWWGLLAFAVILVVALILIQMGVVKPRGEVDIFAIAGIPLFIATIASLAKTYRVQAAGLVRSHISELLANTDLHMAFHELIYAYRDETWEAVKAALPTHLGRDVAPKTPEMRKQSWEALAALNEGRSEGFRYYDPDFFQHSPEERRLDSVLHYFDMLAYNRERHLISVEDITGVAGYHLAVIGSRSVIRYYLARNRDWWEKLPYKQRVGAEEPYRHLRSLLEEIERRNKRDAARELSEESR